MAQMISQLVRFGFTVIAGGQGRRRPDNRAGCRRKGKPDSEFHRPGGGWQWWRTA